jgi:Putative restriction endonuclease
MQLANPPMSGAWTVEHLDADGIRREIFDGTLVVPPLSSGLDSMTVRKLGRLLEPMAPEGTIAGRRFGLLLRGDATYAAAGIPDYWVLDRQACRLTVFGLEPGRSEYSVEAEVDAGTTYRTNRPFAVEFDPAAVC